MLVDTHAHLDYPEYQGDFSEVLRRAREAGVERIISIATGLESSRRVVQLAREYEEIYAVVGVHPNHAHEESFEAIKEIEELASDPKVVAIGETGLDYHSLPQEETGVERTMIALGAGTTGQIEIGLEQERIKMEQAKFFRALLDLAVRKNLNVVIHQRAAWADTLEILEEYRDTTVRGVFHCFGESPEEAAQVLEMGHLISFTGIATFKNGGNVREVACMLKPGQFMVETDCPYLAPVPFRGKRCEPAHTRLTAEALAKVRGETLEELARHTTATAMDFFKKLA